VLETSNMAVGTGSRYSKNAGVVFSLRSCSYYAGTVGHVSETTSRDTLRIKKDGNARDVQISAVSHGNPSGVAEDAVVRSMPSVPCGVASTSGRERTGSP
jgi:hypothetical protein